MSGLSRVACILTMHHDTFRNIQGRGISEFNIPVNKINASEASGRPYSGLFVVSYTITCMVQERFSLIVVQIA